MQCVFIRTLFQQISQFISILLLIMSFNRQMRGQSSQLAGHVTSLLFLGLGAVAQISL